MILNTPLINNARIRKPPARYGFTPLLSLTATLTSIPIPTSYKQAMEHECWKKAIETKLLELEENQIWNVIPCPPSAKPLGSKFVYSIKLRSNGSIDRYKAQLVVFGNKKKYGLDYDETFTPIAKMTTIRTILALATSLHQMDVKNTFFSKFVNFFNQRSSHIP